ncbi:MAG: bifunctional 2-polyprenyl-6-hydroxyphenol methylase/3-demethylubiquinol 3-O-methyltransferase UbiG [Rhodospirillales bacterium]|nr:bifunctional 2-polyprenyl-6-hydroxyphenol methylase/3-demethylubiquinol 3-O-methyltransferase UbiG [Rhodospirillales bacterium]MCB9995870.1 bifunctional 2-polyprenyl-6-hydroxyphenol methylase/3-demethylubiquinol 3-O-methyltransferase UbiG [Rhodospirillales bacterium]
MTTSINPQEIEHFAKDSAHWWDEDGPFRPLHRMNPVRMDYICGQIRQHYGLRRDDLKAFGKLELLDIGCGGGLVCEPLARLGGRVTGIDADANAIAVAKTHAAENGLSINYLNGSAEDLKETFDVVLALEIIEHVNNPEQFVQDCTALCKPGGIVIFSTLNRTPQSYAMGIVAAEHVLRWVPRGTHQWKKFIQPAELARAIRHAGATSKDLKGITFNALDGNFKLSSENMSVNYMMTAEKP